MTNVEINGVSIPDLIIATIEPFEFNNVKVYINKVNASEIKEFGSLYVLYELKENCINAVICYTEDYLDFSSYNNPYMYNRLFDYLEMCGYDNNVVNKCILLILHEIGHLDWMDKLIEFDLIEYASFVQDTVNASVRLSFTPDKVLEHREKGLDTLYFFRADETYADAFAIKHFIRIYKHLLTNEIIKDNNKI